MPVSHDDRLPIDLALQGGGAHGAFTRGVLDRLLQEPDLDLAGINGTSAGAVNAVALDDRAARHTRDPERDPDAVLRHHALATPGLGLIGSTVMALLGAWWPQRRAA